MSLMESFYNFLDEKLNKPFYSPQEAELEKMRDSSQMTKDRELEKPYISYDPFASYANSDILQGISASASYVEKLKKWRDNAMLPEVDEAISEIIGEAIVFDEQEPVIKINLDDVEVSEGIKKKVTDSFEKILFLLDFNERGEELFRQWYVDAKMPIEVVYDNNNMKAGIKKLLLLPPQNILKFKNEQTQEVKWFKTSKNPTYNPLKDLEDAEKTFSDEQITCIDSGVYSPDKRYPLSHLNKALKVINQLYLIEDSLIIYRITRSTEKRVFYVDTGNLPKSKAEEYIKSLILKYRQKKIYNFETGIVENKAKTVSVLEDFWFPVNAAGRGTKVDTLAGAQADLANLADIDYFVNKLYKALNIPTSRRNPEARMSINNTLDVEKEELKFFKFVLRLRRRFNNMFVDLLKKDLLARKVFTLQDWNKIQEKIKFVYANNNAYSEIRQLQILNMRIDAANQAMPLMENKMLSKTRVRMDILKQTEEEMEKIDVEIANETPVEGDFAPDGGGDDGGDEETQPAQPAEPKPSAQPKEEDAPGPQLVLSGLDMAKLAEMIAAKMVAPQPKLPSDAVIISKQVLESLRDGDVINNGDKKILFKNGRFTEID